MPQHFNRIVFGASHTDPGDYYQFDDMIGVFQPKRENLEAIPRRGSRGHTFRKSGVWAEESQITTKLGVSDRQGVIDALAAYTDLINGDSVRVYKHSQGYGYFVVRDVALVEEIPLGTHAGYLLPSATIEMHVGWKLISVYPPS